MQPMMTCATTGDLGEKKKKEQQELVDAATLKLHAASAAMLKGKKRRGLEAPLRKVYCPFCHTSTFLFVSRHNAMLSQCCCLIALNTPRADVPGEEIDPTVVIEKRENRKERKVKSS
jgi:hypothetical protein